MLNEITIEIDRIAQRPAARVRRLEETGSSVRIYWPRQLAGDLRRIRVLARDFTALNPHLTLALVLQGRLRRFDATDPTWTKWLPSSPTSPHWSSWWSTLSG
jgi:hypothetical protein